MSQNTQRPAVPTTFELKDDLETIEKSYHYVFRAIATGRRTVVSITSGPGNRLYVRCRTGCAAKACLRGQSTTELGKDAAAATNRKFRFKRSRLGKPVLDLGPSDSCHQWLNRTLLPPRQEGIKRFGSRRPFASPT